MAEAHASPRASSRFADAAELRSSRSRSGRRAAGRPAPVPIAAAARRRARRDQALWTRCSRCSTARRSARRKGTTLPQGRTSPPAPVPTPPAEPPPSSTSMVPHQPPQLMHHPPELILPPEALVQSAAATSTEEVPNLIDAASAAADRPASSEPTAQPQAGAASDPAEVVRRAFERPVSKPGREGLLADQVGMEVRQVEHWFTNRRKRHWKKGGGGAKGEDDDDEDSMRD